MRYLFLLYHFVLIGVLLWTAYPCAGVEPARVEGIVYRLHSFQGSEHQLVYVPPQAAEIYLLAGCDNIIDPRQTLVYYWPLAREYFESWDRLDVPVKGNLEILKEGRAIQILSREAAVLSYPEGAKSGKSIVYAGGKAKSKHEEHEKLMDQFKQDMAGFGEKMVEYRRSLQEYMRSNPQNDPASVPPKQPVEPVPPLLYVSNPVDAFVVNLPAGHYSVRIREEDGSVVEGSEKTVVVFAPTETKAIGYEIIPEERWTARDAADDSEAAIYYVPGRTIYLIPYSTVSYDENSYVRLTRPQGTGGKGVSTRIHAAQLTQMRLVLLQHDQQVHRIDWKEYYVRQSPGAELGYKIVECNKAGASNESPTFSAFLLQLEEKDRGNRYDIFLEDPATGKLLLESKRELRVVRKGNIRGLWFLALVPSIFGVALHTRRKRKKWVPGKK